jgi:hypothetical protein
MFSSMLEVRHQSGGREHILRDRGTKMALKGTNNGGGTYSMSSTSANIVGEAINVAWISHEDCCLDHVYRRCGERNSSVSIALIRISTSAKCVVKDLATLRIIISFMLFLPPRVLDMEET